MGGLTRLLAALLLATSAAGCLAGRDAPGPDIVIRSDASAAAPGEATMTGPLLGDLEGTVVDGGGHPIAAALVAIGATDRQAVTDAAGGFAIHGLAEGSYPATATATGFEVAAGAVSIQADRTTFVTFVLLPLEPSAAYHETLVFTGKVLVTSDPITGWDGLICEPCDWRITLGGDVETLVLEVTMDTTGPPVQPFPDPLDLGHHTIWWSFGPNCGSYESHWFGTGSNPLLARNDHPQDGAFCLQVNPYTYPMPEPDRTFHVYLTVFHGQDAPEGWTYPEKA